MIKGILFLFFFEGGGRKYFYEKQFFFFKELAGLAQLVRASVL
jgi:hypothetical protein